MTEKEKNALRFYIGDVSGSDGFYGDPKAYVTLNSLFFPGISAEKDRAAEGKRLNPEIAADVPRLLDFFAGLFSAFGKCTAGAAVTHRVERFSDYCYMAASGATISLTSTSKAGFLGSYRDRIGISLMDFFLAEGSPAIDAGRELGFYAKPEEAEILLPPFMRLDIKELTMTEKELYLTDSQGKPPGIYCKAKYTGEMAEYSEESCSPLEDSSTAVDVLKKLSSGCVPEEDETREYSAWKVRLKRELHHILRDCLGG